MELSGSAYFTRLESLVKHAKLNKSETTALFVAPLWGSVVKHSGVVRVVYNYRKGTAFHQGLWMPEISPQWTKWVSMNGFTDSETFKKFLEDNIVNLAASPDQKNEEDLVFLRLADTFDLEWLSGEELFKLVRESEETSLKALFLINLPPFVGVPACRIPVRLNGKMNNGQKLWKIELYNPQITVDFAFDSAVAYIAEELQLEPYYGTPEGDGKP